MTTTSLSAGIVTDDPDQLLAFYVDAFDFVLESTSEFPQGIVHRLRRDDARCKLYAPASGAERKPRPDPWFRDAGFAYAALHVADVETTVRRASAAGATVITPVTAHRPGASMALIADPQGNVWELLQED